MNKKLIFIIIGIAIVGIAVWMYLKNKKKASTSVSTSTNSNLVADKPFSEGTSPKIAPTAVTAANPNPGAGSLTFQGVVREQGGKAILQYQPLKDKFKPGDSVKIDSGMYAGVHKIWYVFDFNTGGLLPGPGQNLYLETPFKGNEKGTFSKA